MGRNYLKMLFNNRSVVKELFMLNDKRHTFDAISSLDMMAMSLRFLLKVRTHFRNH